MSSRTTLYVDLLGDDDDDDSARRQRRRLDPPAEPLLAAGVAEPPRPMRLSPEAVNHVVGVLWLAQALVAPTTTCHLVSGSDTILPNNQQGTITRDVYARVAVQPDLSTLVASGVQYWPSVADRQAVTTFNIEHRDAGIRAQRLPEFHLSCHFTVGRPTLVGALASPDRVPVAVARPGAVSLPWQAYNPVVHTERTDVLSRSGGRISVALADAPNLLLHGDTFFMSTSSEHDLNNVGQSPNEPLEGDVGDAHYARAHFYDDSLLAAFARTGASLHGVPRASVAVAAHSVNIELFDAPTMSLERFRRAQRLVGDMTTVQQLEAVVRTIVVERREAL